MIKAIVFDLDNTLIPWLEQFDQITKDSLKQCNLPNDDNTFHNFQNAMKSYESTHIRFKKVEMSKYFAEYMKLPVPDDFLDIWTTNLYDAIPDQLNEDLVSLLEYLSKKYKLFVTTNWFTDQQVARLDNYGILKYFEKVYGCDIYDRKPYSEMMELILKDYDFKEIVYVGDSYPIDVKFAMNLNIFAYYITKTDKKRSVKFKVISDVCELRNYL